MTATKTYATIPPSTGIYTVGRFYTHRYPHEITGLRADGSPAEVYAVYNRPRDRNRNIQEVALVQHWREAIALVDALAGGEKEIAVSYPEW